MWIGANKTTLPGSRVKHAAVTRIARAPVKNQLQRAPGTGKLDGIVLGTNRKKEQVKVKREVGSTQGYDSRWQAIGIARLAKAEPAAVVLGTDRKWHALETTAAFEPGRVSDNPTAAEVAASGNALFVEVHGVPLRSAINTAKTREARAAAILGVPESDIRVTIALSGRAAGVINIIGSPEKGSPGGGHGPLGGSTEFKDGVGSALWIDLPELDRDRIAETLFHEAQHLQDWQLAQAWIDSYKKETGRMFVESATAPFAAWLKDQVAKKRLTKAEAELVIMEIPGASAYTEARANIRSFLADLQAGDATLAKKTLVAYARALKPRREGGNGQYANPAGGSEVQAALVAELKAAYAQMSTEMRGQYDAAVAAALVEYPSAWFSVLDFAKRKGK